MIAIITDEEFEDLITSYDFITKIKFVTTEQVKIAMEYCQEKGRLSEDIADYLLDLLNTLPDVETTEDNEDWKTAGISAN